MPAAFRLAAAAAEMNGRHSLVGLSKDGLSLAAFDSLGTKTDASGKADPGATAKAHLEAARDFFVEAATPDKALMLGLVAGAAGDKPNVGSGIAGGAVGLLADALEAIPAALVSLVYLGSAGFYAARASIS